MVQLRIFMSLVLLSYNSILQIIIVHVVNFKLRLLRKQSLLMLIIICFHENIAERLGVPILIRPTVQLVYLIFVATLDWST